jgi:hypothetical protein
VEAFELEVFDRLQLKMNARSAPQSLTELSATVSNTASRSKAERR